MTELTKTPTSFKVFVMETSVFGVRAYHAKCAHCEYVSKRVSKEAQALEFAKAHGNAHAESKV